jgi:tripartite-type tricarboxylate transporter receptor subunit TctC
MVNRIRFALNLAVAGALWVTAGFCPTFAADFPSRVVRFVVPSSPGGALDVLARIMSRKLTQKWGQSVVVDNRAGAGGIIGTDIVAKAAPDGYTLLIVTTGFVTNPYLYKNLPYRTPDGFTPITILGFSPNALVAHPSLPVHTIKELIAYAKEKPGQLNYASSGVGSGGYLSMELLKKMAAISITHVPYNGAGAATTAVLSGQTQLLFTAIGTVLPQINGKALTAIAVSGTKRSEALPDVPTVAESGLPGYSADGWYAVIGPAGMPKSVVDTLYRDLDDVLKMPDVVAQFGKLGFDGGGMPPTEFAQYIRAQIKTWAAVLEKSPVEDAAGAR